MKQKTESWVSNNKLVYGLIAVSLGFGGGNLTGSSFLQNITTQATAPIMQRVEEMHEERMEYLLAANKQCNEAVKFCKTAATAAEVLEKVCAE
jgi:ribulose 1,5-bisphosphate synthetase/thiazole synthase